MLTSPNSIAGYGTALMASMRGSGGVKVKQVRLKIKKEKGKNVAQFTVRTFA